MVIRIIFFEVIHFHKDCHENEYVKVEMSMHLKMFFSPWMLFWIGAHLHWLGGVQNRYSSRPQKNDSDVICHYFS